MGRKKHTENPDYKHRGEWSWNDPVLWSHVEVSLNTNDCWLWNGSMSPSGALFGARKNGIAQMTQARRLIWMSQNNKDAAPYRMTMTCQNQQCVNPNHFELKSNNRRDKWAFFGDDNV